MKNINKIFIIFIFSLSFSTLFPATTHAQTWEWGRGNTGGGIDAWSVITDKYGFIYGAGASYAEAATTFGPYTISPLTLPATVWPTQCVLAKYDSAGNVDWVKGIQTGFSENVNMVTDTAGNLILAVVFSTHITIDTFNVYGPDAMDYAVIKFDTGGHVLWAVECGEASAFYNYYSYPGAGFFILTWGAVAVDVPGNVYLAGNFNNATTTIGGTTLTNTGTGTDDVFVAKLSGATGAPVWATSFGGSSNDDAYGMAVNSMGDVYVTGAFASPSAVVGPSTIANPYSYEIAYVAEFSPTGAPMWAEAAGGANGAYGAGMVSDAAGNVYVSGSFGDETIAFGTTTITRTYPGTAPSTEAFLVQLNSANAVTWQKTIGSPATSMLGYCIALASCGQVWVSGSWPDFFSGLDSANIDGHWLYTPPGSGDPVFIAGYNLSGGVVGYAALQSGADDQNGIACDPTGNVYICSDYEITNFIVGPDTLSADVGGEMFYVAKFTNVVTTDTTRMNHDTVVCSASGLLIAPPVGYIGPYLWSTGATTDSIRVYTTGTYWVKTPSSCGLPYLYDTIHVTFTTLDSAYHSIDTSMCQGNSIVLTGPLGYPYYTWNTGDSTDTLTVGTPGTYWIIANNNCNFVFDTFHVTNHPLPVVNIGNDTGICPGVSLNLTSPEPVGSTYLWNTGSTGNTISITDSGTYWLTVSDSGCSKRDSIHIYFHAVPQIAIGNDTAFCANDSVTLSSIQPAGSVYLWSTGSTGSSIIVKTTGTYWLQVTDTGCTNTDTIDIAVHSLPIVNIGNDTGICPGDSVMLTSAEPVGSTYLWNTGSMVNAIFILDSGTYWLQVTDSGCTARDSMHMYFHAVPQIALGNDTGFCQGDSVTLSSVQPAGSVFLWSNGSTGNTIVADSTGTYWLNVTDTGCSSTDSIHITVTPPPVIHLGSDTIICSMYVLQPSPVNAGVTYIWSTGSITDTIHVDTTGNYWVQETLNNCSNADTVQIYFVKDSFVLYNRDTSICAGNVVQVVSYFDTGMVFQWIPTAGIRFSTSPDPLITPDTSATYVVTAQFLGCPPIIDSFHIDVQPNPSLFISDNRQVCQFDTLHLNAQVSPAWYTQYAYTWSPTQVLDHTNTPTVVFSSPTTTTVYLTVSTPAGCSATDSVLIVVHPNGFGSISSDTTICPHDSVLLVAAGGSVYHWSPALYLSDTASGQPWVHPVTTQLYTVIATSMFGCYDTMTVNITVQPGAYLVLPDSEVLYPGQTYQMNPLTNCVDFRWFPPAGLNSFIISNPVADPGVTTKYYVTASTEYGCSTLDSIYIIIDPSTLIAMPNVFSPGSGGPNSILYILKLGDATLNYYRVFNRWGNLVFQTNNIDAGWDGTFNGTPQPEDVYIYEIQAVTNTGVVFTKKGNITLLR